jgi:hypothetical protein
MNYRYFYFLFFCFLVYSCEFQQKTQLEQENNIVLTINQIRFNVDEGHIIVPVKINDSIDIRLLFDTGGGGLTLDSTFWVKNRLMPQKKTIPNTIIFPFLQQGRTNGYRYKNKLSLTLGANNINYIEYEVVNLRSLLKSLDSLQFEGLFNIPVNDTLHVWELNFEHSYMEVHTSSSFSYPKNVLVLPFKWDKWDNFSMDLPLTIIDNSDTLSTKESFLVDSGAQSTDMMLFPPSLIVDYFKNARKLIFYEPNDYDLKHITVAHYSQACISNQLMLDSLLITYKEYNSHFKGGGLVGLDFLKRFNVYFDFRNKKILLAQNPNYKSPQIKESVKRSAIKSFAMSKKDNAYYILKLPKFFNNNVLTKAEVKEGDEIVRINNYSGADIYNQTITMSEIEQQSDSIDIEIKRNGQTMILKCKAGFK